MLRLLLITPALILMAAPARAAAPPAEPFLEALVERLGSEEYETREAAQGRLLALGLREVPEALARATDSPDLETRRRARRIKDKMFGEIKARARARAIQAGRRGEIDLMVDGLLFSQPNTLEQDGWREALEVIASLLDRVDKDEPSGANRPNVFRSECVDLPALGWHDAGPQDTSHPLGSPALGFLRSRPGQYRSLVLAGGSVLFSQGPSMSAALVNGDAWFGTVMSSVVVSDGDVEFRSLMHSVVIARGNVRGHCDCYSAAYAGGDVTRSKFCRRVYPRQRRPLGFVRFYEVPECVGVVPSKFAPRLERIDEGTTFARAGLRPGDLIFESDGVPLRTVDCFRRSMRRQAARDASARLLVRRDGRWLTLLVPPVR